MKESIAKKIAKYSSGTVDASEYSGRGMFGDQTWSVSGNEEDVIQACKNAKVSMKNFEVDNLGMGFVYY